MIWERYNYSFCQKHDNTDMTIAEGPYARGWPVERSMAYLGCRSCGDSTGSMAPVEASPK